ncbi:MAG: transposase [Bryobacteraceae bacterium]
MPRFARVVVPECAHHITQRGNARRDVFYTTPDRMVYLHLLREYSKHYGVRILGYCLMTNHVHLVAIPTRSDSLAKAMREVHGRYARYRNTLDRQSGHLWQNRYFSCAVEERALGSVMRYVELNPVRAGIVASAADYVWSSAATHLGGPDALGLVAMGDSSVGWAADEWAEILRQGEDDADAIRQARYSGRPFGSDGFITGLEHTLCRDLARRKPLRARNDSAVVAVS